MTSQITTQPDVLLLLDMGGVIREATLAGRLSGEGVDAWLGRPWAETLEDIGSDKIRRMVEDARATGISAFKQVLQRFPSGLEVPIEYTTILMGGRSGLLVVGKNLQAVAELQSRLIAAQQAMERDRWKLRDVETRYRLLFEASNEAILVVNAANLRIVEANPAALAALGVTQTRSDARLGRDFLTFVSPKDRGSIETMLIRTRQEGKAPGILVHLGHESKPWMLRASLVTSVPGFVFIIQLSSLIPTSTGTDKKEIAWVHDLLNRVPDGFVVVDTDGVIRVANNAFVELAEVGSVEAMIGHRLQRWLWQPGADLKVLLKNIQEHGFIRLFQTTVRGELGTNTEVEVSAVGNNDKPDRIGLLMRDVTRRLPLRDENDLLRAALQSTTEQIGRTPLRSLVKNTVGIVEQHYMRAALELSGNNRTAAAEMLGLSRQSLYSKLSQYGLDHDGQIPDA